MEGLLQHPRVITQTYIANQLKTHRQSLKSKAHTTNQLCSIRQKLVEIREVLLKADVRVARHATANDVSNPFDMRPMPHENVEIRDLSHVSSEDDDDDSADINSTEFTCATCGHECRSGQMLATHSLIHRQSEEITKL